MMLAFSCFCDAHFHLCDVKSVKINDYSLQQMTQPSVRPVSFVRVRLPIQRLETGDKSSLGHLASVSNQLL